MAAGRPQAPKPILPPPPPLEAPYQRLKGDEHGWLSKLWSLLGPPNTRCRMILRIQKGTIILATTQMTDHHNDRNGNNATTGKPRAARWHGLCFRPYACQCQQHFVWTHISAGPYVYVNIGQHFSCWRAQNYILIQTFLAAHLSAHFTRPFAQRKRSPYQTCPRIDEAARQKQLLHEPTQSQVMSPNKNQTSRAKPSK